MEDEAAPSLDVEHHMNLHHGNEQQEQLQHVEMDSGSLSEEWGRQTPSFNRLPRNVIERILYTADPNVFASLVLLNRKWRRISDSYALYAHHLAQCPSSRAEQFPARYSENLDVLKHKFFAEIRRNMFDVFLRPRRTFIKLMSTSMSSSTAFPHGEAFRFSFSVSGQLVLCISSSRIVILDVTTERPVIRHELQTSRRPLDATILDDGSLLAVLSTKHQINVYTLSNESSNLIQCLALDDTPRALALSPAGGVLAIAYGDKIEVQAVGEGLLATERRSVRCNGIDSIVFSSDGSMLLGSSADGQNDTIVSITIPFFTETEDDTSPSDAQARMWTSQVLFPNIVRGYTRASFLPLRGEGEGDWILGYEKQQKAFRAIRTNNADSGTIYLVSPLSGNGADDTSPDMSPAADGEGELVALGYQDSGLWLYGVPDHLGVVSSPTGSLNSTGERYSRLQNGQQANGRPNVLLNGRKMSDIPGITAARWVRYSHFTENPVSQIHRLMAVAPGGVRPPTIGEEDVPVDGGRVLLLDFRRSTQNGQTIEIDIEVGESEPKVLREPNSSMATEVELERRRTRLHRGNTTAPPRRVRNAAARESYPSGNTSQKLCPRHRRNSSYQSGFSNNARPNGVPLNNNNSSSHQPRETLHRAATAAPGPRGSNYSQPVHRQMFPQIPHESDADNWVPPPPPYTPDPEIPLPEHLRQTLLPVSTRPARRAEDQFAQFRRARCTRLDSMVQDDLSRPRPTLHRLNTITARMRRLIDPEPTGPYLGQRYELQATRTSLGQSPQSPPTTTPGRQFQQSTAIPVEAVANATQQPDPVSAGSPASPPPSRRSRIRSNPSSQTDHVVSQAMASNLMEPLPPMPQTESTEEPPRPPNNYPFSLSSPNLRNRVPNPDTPEETSPLTPMARRTWYQRAPAPPPNGRSQSQDLRQLATPAIPPINRRVSTDPTLSTRSPSTAAANENWRRRIEEWNERTIYETNKRNRSKCVVM